MQHVDVKVHDGVGTILMDRQHVHNAVSLAMMDDLQQALSDLHQEKRVRSVVLAGSGGHFCSGVDLSLLDEISRGDPANTFSLWHEYWSRLTETLEHILRFPKPVIAAVDGAAVGAGFSLALAADIIVASEESYFTAAAPARGLVGGATAALLNFRIGGSLATRLCLTSEQVSAAEAQRIGLCARVVDSDQVWVVACEVARSTHAGPAEAVTATKRLLNETIGETLLSQLAAAGAASATACTTEAATEGVRAFLEKRDPHWP